METISIQGMCQRLDAVVKLVAETQGEARRTRQDVEQVVGCLKDLVPHLAGMARVVQDTHNQVRGLDTKFLDRQLDALENAVRQVQRGMDASKDLARQRHQETLHKFVMGRYPILLSVARQVRDLPGALSSVMEDTVEGFAAALDEAVEKRVGHTEVPC